MDPRKVLEDDFPDLRVVSLKRIGEGWDHVAFLVNGTHVFRLPLDQDTPSVLPEVELLRAVAGQLPVAVPEPVHVPDHGRYFGYRYLPGRGLDDLREPEAAFADLVVDVVTAIEHAARNKDMAAVGLPRADLPRYPEEDQEALRSDLLSTGMRSVFQSVSERLPELWTVAMSRPTVTLHNDLGLDHWLVDDTDEPYALIDWSDSCIGPPELQLSTLMWHVPELAPSVARRYAQRTNRVIDGDLIFCCGYANALSDLGELLREDDADDEDIEWCLTFLRRWSQPQLASTLRG